MPSLYAHYRFGIQMLRLMPGDICRTAKRNRPLFEVGLCGPDLFFFRRPMISGKGHRLGHGFHMQTGREFFSRACRNLRLESGEGGQAYLYGALCHFALDASCHPLVVKADRDGLASHRRIETEFDRYLMEVDGIRNPDQIHLTERMHLTGSQCATVSRCYPGTDKKMVRESLRTMTGVWKLLELPEGPGRRALIKTACACSEAFRDMIPEEIPDPLCAHLNLPLLERYQQAADGFPELLLKLSAHLTYNAPLGDGFEPIFG